jgi:L-fuconolactonase
MAIARENWLKLTAESAIEPDLPICDPHHHLWYPADRHYPADSTYQTGNSYTLEDLMQDISGGHRIVRTVFIESRKMLKMDAPPEMQPVGETEFVRNVVARYQPRTSYTIHFSSGIVGFADLTLGEAVAPVLEAHIAAGQSRFRGIRYTSTWDKSPEIKSSSRQGILADSQFRAGFACLQKYELSFDAWLYHPQLMELVDLAHSYPDTGIVLDHIGGPLGIGPYSRNRDEVVRDWKKSIAALAGCQNVAIKLGGLGMELCGFGWHDRAVPPGSQQLAEAFSPYFLWCIEKFGVHRCMFESNFPVDKRSYSYTVLWNAFKRFSKDFSDAEKRALFRDTAVNVYRLPVDP